MTTTYPGLGAADAVPRINPAFEPRGAALTPEDYFVLTRVDGRTPLAQICLISGFPLTQATEILRRLRQAGAILLPGDEARPAPPPVTSAPAPAPPSATSAPAPAPPPATSAPAPAPPSATSAPAASSPAPPPAGTPPAAVSPAPAPPAAVVSPTPARPAPAVHLDPAVLAEAVDLTEEQKRSILTKHASLGRATYFELLECGTDADKKTVKRAYFKISKDFHPDRFFGRNLGSYRERIGQIFEAITQAHEVLADDTKRAAYLHHLGGTRPAPDRPKVRAAAHFEQACHLQVIGELDQALDEFAAVLRDDPQGRYYRRAAECALSARRLSLADEYAKKAADIDPRDAGTRRTLARVHRAAGRLADARRELESARRLDPDNEHIASELEEIERLQDPLRGRDAR